MSQPSTPSEVTEEQAGDDNVNGINAGLERAFPSPIDTSGTATPKGSGTGAYSPPSPSTPGLRRGHSRTASLGTTMTSPSTRRRSLESTISLIHGVLDGDKITEEDPVDGIASRLAGSSVGNSNAAAAGNANAGTTGDSGASSH
jgi:serine/threonine-protein phosphatase 2B catalytic subunit